MSTTRVITKQKVSTVKKAYSTTKKAVSSSPPSIKTNKRALSEENDKPEKELVVEIDVDDDFESPKSKKQKATSKKQKKPTKNEEGTPVNSDDDDFEPIKQKTKKKQPKSKANSKLSLVEEVDDTEYAREYNSMAKVSKSDMKVGAHLSIADGIDKVPASAVSVGATAFALFTGSQRQWARKLPSEEVCKAFKEQCTKHKFSPKHILPHGSYLVNLGSPEADKLEKSRELFLLEMKSCQMLGLNLYNFHPGSHKSQITEDECLAKIAESINIAHTKVPGVTAVLEVTAGAGHQVGQHFEHIKKIIDGVTDKTRVGVCLDTCHMFAAGYNIKTEKGYMSVMEKFNEIVGLKYLKGMHINDSKSTLGSKADRHANIGKGEIGTACFERIMNDPHLKDIPMILETEGPWADEIKLLFSLIKHSE